MECRKIKSKVITLANYNGRRQSNETIRAQTKCMRRTRVSGCRQFMIGFAVTSDWLRRWRESF